MARSRSSTLVRVGADSTGKIPAAAAVNSLDWQSVVLHGSMSAASALASIGVVLFLVYFLLLSGDHYKRKLLAAISTRMAHQKTTLSILNGVGEQLQRYIGVLTVTNVAMGILTGLAFYAMGVQHAGAWGVLAAVLHVVPYLGPAVIAIGAALAAWGAGCASRHKMCQITNPTGNRA